MEASDFVSRFPQLYHLTFTENLTSLREHGLHSTASLAELYAFDADERQACLGSRRRCLQTLHGIKLRDQHTAPESKMKSCLVGITIPEWLALLNAKVFFSVTRDRVERLLTSYAAYDNLLLTVDTASLLDRYALHVSLCRINSGAFRVPVPRGRQSFIPLDQYLYTRRNLPAELTVDVPVSDILSFATCECIPRRAAEDENT